MSVIDEWKKGTVCAAWNLKSLLKNPRTYLCMTMGFLLCFLLTDRTIELSRQFVTDVQIFEPFVWCFADSDSILFATLVLMLLLTELPRTDAPAAYMMFRASRTSWLFGQLFTVVAVSIGYTVFLLLSSMALCAGTTYLGNEWSETAMLLSFAPDNFEVALRVIRKTVKLTTPYDCTLHVCLLMTQYTLFLSALQLFLTVYKSKRAAVSVVLTVNVVAYLLIPDRFMTWLNLDDQMRYVANLISAWLSPLQHATYIMHNFGYDYLPRLWVTYVIMGSLTILLFVASFAVLRVRGISFSGGNEYE